MMETPTLEERAPGWDSKVRKRARLEVGSIRALADELNISHDDVSVYPGSDMVVWSRVVAHFPDTTGGVEDYLNQRLDITWSPNMKFELTIDCNNAAFEPELLGSAPFEVARILHKLGEKLIEDMLDATDRPFTLVDANGNVVGTAKFTHDDEVDDREFLQPDLDEELS